jgi:hypothetical protein
MRMPVRNGCVTLIARNSNADIAKKWRNTTRTMVRMIEKPVTRDEDESATFGRIFHVKMDLVQAARNWTLDWLSKNTAWGKEYI